MEQVVIEFDSRAAAGAALAERLKSHSFRAKPVVLGLPRGGIPVAMPVAVMLHSPLLPFVVRKIGTPYNPELACGAIASGGAVVWNDDVCSRLGLSQATLDELEKQASYELQTRINALGIHCAIEQQCRGKSAVLVDDGIATGATMKVAVKALQAFHPREICVAVPVAPKSTCLSLSAIEGCSVVCLYEVDDESFGSVGSWYRDFEQVETEECRRMLEQYSTASESRTSTSTAPL